MYDLKVFVTWTSFAFCVTGQFLNEERNPYLEAASKSQMVNQSVVGYFEVRPGAHMFYWFYYADGDQVQAFRKPLIIWIQGGPGLAASGIGNFAEIGPLTMDMQPRNHTWVKGRNLLLLDHPVGTGFSYVTNHDLLVKSDRDMAMDLYKAIRLFYKRHKIFRNTPTYIIGQSYGGKICPRLALYLHTAIKRKSLKINFKGIGIGGGWVNPLESTLVQPDFLYNNGAIDHDDYMTSTQLVKQLEQSIAAKDYSKAVALDDLIFRTFNENNEINFNNINAVSPYPALDELAKKVNKYVKPLFKRKVNQSLEWTYWSSPIYDKLKSNFLISTKSFVERLLNKTSLKIVVYNGNLDVVTPLAGASNWVHKLRWFGAEALDKSSRHRIRGYRNGFYKTMLQFSFWSVFGAGHWVPEENPEAMAHILEFLMDD